MTGPSSEPKKSTDCIPSKVVATGLSSTKTVRRKRTADPPDRVKSPSKSSSYAGIRKSLRSRVQSVKSLSHGGVGGVKLSNLRSRSRRHIFKKQPTKLSPAPPLIRLVQNIRHLNVDYKIGDIVSVKDIGGGTYYAQIRGLAIDAVGDSCCVFTWLIPTTESDPERFRPEHFVLGMEEDVLRDIDCCSLVCRCPADYFRPLASPYFVQSYH